MTRLTAVQWRDISARHIVTCAHVEQAWPFAGDHTIDIFIQQFDSPIQERHSMTIITSPQNPWVLEAKKLQQKKFREAKGLFLAEGLRLAEEAAKSASVEEVYYHEALGATARGEELLKILSAKARRFFQVTSKVLTALAETETPQGILLVCRCLPGRLQDFRPEPGPVVVLDGLQDPGNLGAILRTLWAAGGRGLICLPDTADPYSGKAVRASMGGIFRVPVFRDVTWSATARWASDQGYQTVAARAEGGMDYRRLPWQEKTLLCIGNEARGLLTAPPEEVDERVCIPLAQGAESLNAAVAAGILIYEAVRQNMTG
jgi:TrmH family RNA methyltransferase